MEEVRFSDHREFHLKVGDGPEVSFSKNGFISSINNENRKISIPISLKFLKYNTRFRGDKSGAYLFLPNGPATPLENPQKPIVIVSEGLLESSVQVGLTFCTHKVILRGEDPEIQNLVDITELVDTEIVMRISSNIQNGVDFFTDLNGLQVNICFFNQKINNNN